MNALNGDFPYIVRNGNISQRIPSGFNCFFHRVMPDSMVIGKGIALNVMLLIELPNGNKIGNSSFYGSRMYLWIRIGRWVFGLVEQSSFTLLQYHAKNPSETHCNFLNLFTFN
ncbi:MAG: hypothetical protein ACXABG_14615 [Promethearchaeota archaeon]